MCFKTLFKMTSSPKNAPSSLRPQRRIIPGLTALETPNYNEDIDSQGAYDIMYMETYIYTMSGLYILNQVLDP